jgi:hypothetical protein
MSQTTPLKYISLINSTINTFLFSYHTEPKSRFSPSSLFETWMSEEQQAILRAVFADLPAEEAQPPQTPPKKKRAKKEPKAKDPTSPKGAKNAYIFFCQEKRPLLKEQGVISKDMMKALGAAWSELSEEEKAPYDRMALADRERFKLEKAEHIPSEEEHEEKKQARGKPAGSPKRGRSTYIIFCQDARPDLKERGLNGKEVLAALGAEWKRLKESDNEVDKSRLAGYEAVSQAEKDEKPPVGLIGGGDINAMNITALKKFCVTSKIGGYSKYKAAELDALRAHVKKTLSERLKAGEEDEE